MSTVALSGQDTVVVNNQVLVGFADANCAELEFPNEIASVKTGKNNNAIYGLNFSGQQAILRLRMIRGCSDDQFLNNLLSQQNANFSGTILLSGQFVKKLGDGAGNITSDTYVSAGGVFTKQVPAKTNTEGDVEQSVSMYEIRFATATRVIS